MICINLFLFAFGSVRTEFTGDNAMLTNIGPVDRTLRLIAGILLVIAAFTSSSFWTINAAAAWVSGIIGAVLIITALIRFCPLYRLLGRDQVSTGR